MYLSDKFIKANDDICDFENYVPAPYFRRVFEIDENTASAEITICGLGFYELYINGEEVTKGYLAPYISNTDDICYYDTYDISDKLVKGKNCIGIILGNGFRNSYGGFVWDFHKAECRGNVIVALSVETTDNKGNKEILFEGDSKFKTHPSPILYNDLRMGYYYDSQKEIKNWNMADFDDSDWENALPAEAPKGVKKLCEAEPIKESKKIKPIEIKHFDKLPFAYDSTSQDAKPVESTIRENVYIYDFGVNTAGVTALKINGNPGQKITIRHGEHLIRGNFDMGNTIFYDEKFIDKYYNYAQKDTFICKGGEEYFVPKFKYDGFRYAYVEGLSEEQATSDSLVCIEMHSDVMKKAEFECSCDILNKLYKASMRSDMSNLFYFPTDCPHREKNGWTGDASVSAEQFMLNFTAENSYEEWLNNIRMAQNSKGAIPGIVPTGGWGFEWGNGPAWDSICVSGPYYIYKFTGNKKPIIDNTDMIVKYFNYIMTRRDERGLIAVGLGDWVDPYAYINGKISAPLEVTDTITVYDIAVKAEKLFNVTKNRKAEKLAVDIQNQLRNSVRENLIDFDKMTVSGECQTSQALAISCGIFDKSEEDAAVKRLIKIIEKNHNENACGMIGLRHIFHVLTKFGYEDLAYKMIVSKNRTGYGSWIEDGATTLYESFKDIDGNIDSRNHHFLGDISSWMIQDVCGLKPNPSFNDVNYFEVSPKFVSMLSYAKASYKTEFGNVSVSWKREGNGIETEVIIPKGVCGVLKLPTGEEKVLKTGENTFLI